MRQRVAPHFHRRIANFRRSTTLHSNSRSLYHSASSARSATSPSLSTSSLFGLTCGLVLTGTAIMSSPINNVDNAANAKNDTTTTTATSSEAPAKKIHASDIMNLDFRTLGVCECPPLPDHVPQWIKDQALDSEFQYRDLSAILDLSDHLLYDGLSGEKRIREVYYFCEKIGVPDKDHPGQHEQPHLPPALDFEPQTPGGAKQAPTPAATTTPPSSAPSQSWGSYIRSFIPFAGRSSSAPSQPAGAAISGSTKAFSTFTPEVVHMTATGPEVRAIFHIGKSLCGHKGIVHGGMTAALMDEVSGAATFIAAGGGNFTANLNINYMKPIRAGQYLLVRAQAVKQEGRKTYVNISVEDGTGTVFARGTALYVKPKMLPPSVMVAATQ